MLQSTKILLLVYHLSLFPSFIKTLFTSAFFVLLLAKTSHIYYNSICCRPKSTLYTRVIKLFFIPIVRGLWFVSQGGTVVDMPTVTLGWPWYWEGSLKLFPWPHPAVKLHYLPIDGFILFNNFREYIFVYKLTQSKRGSSGRIVSEVSVCYLFQGQEGSSQLFYSQFLYWELASLQTGLYFHQGQIQVSPSNCLSAHHHCSWVPLGLNCFILFCKWNQFLWRKIKSYLLWSASSRALERDGGGGGRGVENRQSSLQESFSRKWTISGGKGRSLRSSQIASPGMNSLPQKWGEGLMGPQDDQYVMRCKAFLSELGIE